MPSSARMRAAVLPATKAPNVSTRTSASGRSDKAVLPPAGELVGAVAELPHEHSGRMGAGLRRDQVRRVERGVDTDRGPGDFARAEVGSGQCAERMALV